MPGELPHHRTPRRLASLALLALMAGGIACGGVGAYWVGVQREVYAGAAFAAAGLAMLALGIVLYSQIALLQRSVSQAARLHDCLLDLLELARRQSEYARTVAENTTLSDWAKKIVSREKDYEFLSDTIHSAIVRQDWEAAEHLISEMDRELGYRQEAERLRAEVQKARRATTEEQISTALARFETLCAHRRWQQARAMIQRLAALFPGDARIGALPGELESRRQQYKRELLQRYEQAVQMHDVDEAHRLLFELDQYMTPQEAASLKESARSVFKAKLQQLGVQFSLAVSDRRYAQAIEIGERVMRDYPNTRYAHEIADMMPALRQRAAQSLQRDATPAVG